MNEIIQNVPFYKRILRLLFVEKCPICREPLKGEIACCVRCQKQITDTHISRQFIVKDKFHSHNFTCKAVYFYTTGLRKTIHTFKFRGKTVYAASLGKMMAEKAIKFNMHFDAVAFVPMTKNKLRERGYNQAELLAKEIGNALQIPVCEFLFKERETRFQHKLSRQERKENVKDVFTAKDAFGKIILLVDDICTTGLTLSACAEALYQDGAKSVQAITAASASLNRVGEKR